MDADDEKLAFLLLRIEEELNWGNPAKWSDKDFSELSDRIAGATSVALSSTTLKRVWGRVAYRSRPSTTTLDALAGFAGYGSWREVPVPVSATDSAIPGPVPETMASSAEGKSRRPLIIGWLVITGLLVLATLLYPRFAPATAPASSAAPDSSVIEPDDYYFNFHPVATGVPNSVVFNYRAEKAPTGEVYLQQNWDPRRREKLARNRSTHTSIYYLPGYYRAKLVVSDEVVAERDLYITADDWVAAVATDPVPVYLPLNDCRHDGRLSASTQQLTDLGLVLQPEPPTITFSHVGAFDHLRTDDFSFRTRLRHDYAVGAGICQYVRVLLLLKNSIISIPLSAPGCVAELELYAGGQTFSGTDNDLSAFGVVGDNWLDVDCEGKDGLLTFYLNGRQVFQVESAEAPREIIGVRYEFRGAGSVEEVVFARGNEVIWKDNFQ